METLTDHGRCCFVQLLGYQPLTDGVCDDVLDVVEGIAGETVIELRQEENNMRERYDSDKKRYVPKSIAGETTMKMMHEEVRICIRYVCHNEMCI